MLWREVGMKSFAAWWRGDADVFPGVSRDYHIWFPLVRHPPQPLDETEHIMEMSRQETMGIQRAVLQQGLGLATEMSGIV